MTKRQHERGEPAPGTLPWIQLQFPDEAACVRYLTAKRWPDELAPVWTGHLA